MICIKQNRQANEKKVYWRYVMSLEEEFQPLTSRLLWLLQPEAITQFFQNSLWKLNSDVWDYLRSIPLCKWLKKKKGSKSEIKSDPMAVITVVSGFDM